MAFSASASGSSVKGGRSSAQSDVKRLAGASTIGPILLGMGAPVHVLQAGDDVDDIVAMASVAVMDAMGR